MQQLIPHGVLLLPAAIEQVSGQALHRLGGRIRGQIHGNLTQQQGAVAKFFQLEAQLLHHGHIAEQLSRRRGGQPHRQGGQQGLAGNALLIGLELVKENPLMGGVFVDEEGVLPLLHQDIGAVQLPHQTPVRHAGHIQFLLDVFRLFRLHGRHRNLLRFGHFRLCRKRGQTAYSLLLRLRFCSRTGRNRNRLSRNRHRAVEHRLVRHGLDNFFHCRLCCLGLGLGGILHGGGEGFVFLRGHGAEEILLGRRFLARLYRLRRGSSLLCKLHLGTVGGFVQRRQNAIVNAVKHRLLVEEFHFRLCRMDVDIHRIGRKL